MSSQAELLQLADQAPMLCLHRCVSPHRPGASRAPVGFLAWRPDPFSEGPGISLLATLTVNHSVVL